MRSRHPAGTENSQRYSLIASKVFDPERGECAYTHVGQISIMNHSKRFTVSRAEQENQPAEISGSDAIFLFRSSALVLDPVDDVGFHADRVVPGPGIDRFHGTPAIDTLRVIGRCAEVDSRSIHQVSFGKVDVSLFQRLQAAAHRKDLFDFLIVYKQRHPTDLGLPVEQRL